MYVKVCMQEQGHLEVILEAHLEVHLKVSSVSPTSCTNHIVTLALMAPLYSP